MTRLARRLWASADLWFVVLSVVVLWAMVTDNHSALLGLIALELGISATRR